MLDIQELSAEPELTKSTVYFDGSCPLCRAEIGYYRRKDQVGALCFVDISGAGAAPPEGVAQQRAMKRFGTAAAITTASLGAARAAMRAQTGPDGALINVVPSGLSQDAGWGAASSEPAPDVRDASWDDPQPAPDPSPADDASYDDGGFDGGGDDGSSDV